MTDGEARPLRAHHVNRLETKEWLALRRERNDRIRNRLIITATLMGIVLLLSLVWWVLDALGIFALPPAWVWWLGLFAVVMVLGFVGRPVGKALVKSAVLPQGVVEPLKAPFVMDALVSLGIGRMNRVEDIGLLFDVARVGPGYHVDLELPRGVTATSVMGKRDELSAALRRELGTVWPSVGKRHQGHLALYVSDQPMATAKQSRWPLLKDGEVDLFTPVPMFTDQRGVWVNLTLAYTANGVIGAVPRMGKTFALRQLLLVGGLDKRAKVYAFDLKGTGDLSPCALFAHAYGVGEEPEDIEEQLVAMRGLRTELRRRAKVIRELPREECPESKVTSMLASRKSLGLEPILIGIDETQVWFEHEDKEIREEFIAVCTDIAKRGPALGMMIYFATQNVTAKTIPTAISNNAIVRLCLKVFGYQANDQILGTGAYKGQWPCF